jgi:(1->4)-alpha-D-glucan 1-alpha-D-glucosylmutase
VSTEVAGAPRPPSTPRATYRIQLGPTFTFADAERVAPYLKALGASHVYLSPILKPVAGSTHGYDVVDHRHVNPELGGEDGYEALGRRLGELGLGQVLDIVPNHMAIGSDNPWWWDVLENGPASRFAAAFDVEWAHPERHLRDRVLLPILGDHYGRVLEDGELRLVWDGERFTIRYHEHLMPVAPRSLDELLRVAAARAGSDELAFLADAFRELPPSTSKEPADRVRRHRDKEVLGPHLAEYVASDPRAAEAVDAAVAAVNADVDELDRLLERQNYRLAWWRSASRDLGYRRFFDVTTLVGLRTEDEHVFAATHALILPWLEGGVIDGVRIDHIDGLRDPEGYLRRLRWAGPRGWIVAEKILEPGEELRRSWPIAGTTGYDFLHRAQAVLLDPAGEQPLDALYVRFTGETAAWHELALEGKAEVLDNVLGSELGRLTALLLDVLERHRRHRDHTRHDLAAALRELLVAFPIYRTYVRPTETDGPTSGAGHVSTEDETAIKAAVTAATQARPDIPADLFEAIGDLLLLRLGGELEAEFVLRFQQLSGAVMAKGIEDTALYRYLRLVALNEVGADAGGWAMASEAFHATNAAAAERWPTAMLATSTHDTKRSEDVRARLLVLAEIPDEWAAAVDRWSELLARHRTADPDLPDRNTEYLLYQTFVGAWPIDGERLARYLTKAVREAKRHTTWTAPNAAYESAVLGFAAAALADEAFTTEVEAFVRRLMRPARINSLAMTLLKLAAPGVPDLYQGTELWDLSLVDPDNRRPVDFELRERLLREVGGCSPEELAASLDDPNDPGLAKLAVVRAGLGLRARRPTTFESGGYRPILAHGEHAEHVIAFGRGDDVVAVVPRLGVRLDAAGGSSDTTLEVPAGAWTDVISGERLEGGPVEVGSLLRRFPLALLERAAE